MAAQQAFQVMLGRHVSPLMREAGFKRSGATWRLQSPQGDVALVNLQKSRWNVGDEVNFYVNLAVLPVTWWEYLRERELKKGPATPSERHGMLRQRLDPPKDPAVLPKGWVVRDVGSADTCGQILNDQLRQAIPEAAAMLDRRRLVTVVRGGAAGWWVVPGPELAVAYVVADQGPSRELDEALDLFDRHPHSPRDAQRSAWLRRRAATAQERG